MVTKFTKWEEQKAVICHAVSMQLIHRFIFKLYMLKNEWTFYSRLPTKTEQSESQSLLSITVCTQEYLIIINYNDV